MAESTRSEISEISAESGEVKARGRDSTSRPKRDNRRFERRKALNVLYHLEVMGETRKLSSQELAELLRDYELDEGSFASQLLELTLTNLDTVDEALLTFIESYRWSALPPLERSLLRLGTAQVLMGRSLNVPVEVAIDETIEMAKRYSYRNFYKFANAILDKIAKYYKLPESSESGEDAEKG